MKTFTLNKSVHDGIYTKPYQVAKRNEHFVCRYFHFIDINNSCTVVSHVLVSNLKIICPKMHTNPKISTCTQPFGGFKPLPRLSAIFGHFFDFCRLFLPSYLINPRTQNHSFPSWAIEGSKVYYIKKLTFCELLKHLKNWALPCTSVGDI